MKPWTEWSHVVKIDPDKSLPTGTTPAAIATTGTDAIVIGGTTGVTPENIRPILVDCEDVSLPVYLEPNSPTSVVHDDRIDGYLLPTVLNAGSPFWIGGAHAAGATLMPEHPYERSTLEGYLVLNPESAVASYTESDCDLTAIDVAAFARVAEQLFDLEIVYIEYSGTFGDLALVEAAAGVLSDATLWYGGGVTDFETARSAGSVADVVVVGDLVHEGDIEAVRRTVEGVATGAATNEL